MVYLMMLVGYTASNGMISINNKLEEHGGGHWLVWGIILASAWIDWGKPEKNLNQDSKFPTETPKYALVPIIINMWHRPAIKSITSTQNLL